MMYAPGGAKRRGTRESGSWSPTIEKKGGPSCTQRRTQAQRADEEKKRRKSQGKQSKRRKRGEGERGAARARFAGGGEKQNKPTHLGRAVLQTWWKENTQDGERDTFPENKKKQSIKKRGKKSTRKSVSTKNKGKAPTIRKQQRGDHEIKIKRALSRGRGE